MWGLCAGVVAWNLVGCATLTPVATAALDHKHYWIAGNDTALIHLLTSAHVHTLISNDYWVGMRLTFESDERVITVMRFPDGHLGFNRYPPYAARGLADPQPGYLELVGTAEAAALVQRAATLPTYHLLPWGQFILLLPNK
ncbi:MAG: hypothetical protein H0X24_25300, partial [Ktedonobacterales bacterium]|nr:hypothetical protein [Ktedonobacterales bacterium]